MFMESFAADKTKLDQYEALADVFSESLSHIGLDAYTVGDRDLALPLSLLRKVAKRSKFPYLSANILVDGKPVFQPSVLKTVAGFKIAVIGATTTLFANNQERMKAEGFTMSLPVDAVQAEIARRKSDGVDLFVVLGHLNDTEMKEIAAKCPEVRILVGGQGYPMQQLARREKDTWIAEAFMRGKNLAVLELTVKGKSFAFSDPGVVQGLEGKKANLERDVKYREEAIEAAKKPKPAPPPVAGAVVRDQSGNVKLLEESLVRLKTDLAAVKLDLEDAREAQAKSSGAETSTLKYALFDVDTRLADEPKVKAIVDAYRKKYPDPSKSATPPVAPAPAVKVEPRAVPSH